MNLYTMTPVVDNNLDEVRKICLIPLYFELENF